MQVQVFTLLSRSDIHAFTNGTHPSNVLVRTFNSEDAFQAYRQALNVYVDLNQSLYGVVVTAGVVTYEITRPDEPSVYDSFRTEFSSKDAAYAFVQGLKDFEGSVSPMVVSDVHTDDFKRLLKSWVNELIDVETTEKVVPVRHWESYSGEVTENTHLIEMHDARMVEGQAYLTVCTDDGKFDELISATAEVNSNPLKPDEDVPCLHIHHADDELVFTLFAAGDSLMLRPEVGVILREVTVMDRNVRTRMYMVE